MTLLHIKSIRNISNLVFDDMCGAFKKCLLNDNKFPRFIDVSKKLMKNSGLKFVNIHVYLNDCMQYIL